MVASYAHEGEFFVVKEKQQLGYVWDRDGALRLKIGLEKVGRNWAAMTVEAVRCDALSVGKSPTSRGES